MAIDLATKLASLGLTVKTASRGRQASGKTAPTHGILYANGKMRAWISKFDPTLLDGRKSILPEFVEIEKASANYSEVANVMFDYAAETFRSHLAAVQANGAPNWTGSFVAKPRQKNEEGDDFELDECAA